MRTIIRAALLGASASLFFSLLASPASAADPIVVTPQVPTANPAPCGSTEGSVDIPSITGIEYALDGIPGPGGQYLADVGPHDVSASTFDGYVFPTGYPAVVEWTVMVTQQTCAPPPPTSTHIPPGHHYGWQRGKHNPHRHPVNPCAVWHPGCPSDVNVPPPPFPGTPPHFPR